MKVFISITLTFLLSLTPLTGKSAPTYTIVSPGAYFSLGLLTSIPVGLALGTTTYFVSATLQGSDMNDEELKQVRDDSLEYLAFGTMSSNLSYIIEEIKAQAYPDQLTTSEIASTIIAISID